MWCSLHFWRTVNSTQIFLACLPCATAVAGTTITIIHQGNNLVSLFVSSIVSILKRKRDTFFWALKIIIKPFPFVGISFNDYSYQKQFSHYYSIP